MRRVRDSLYGVQPEPDGGAVIRVELESEEAALAYALALGAKATVLEPQAIRQAVVEAARGMLLWDAPPAVEEPARTPAAGPFLTSLPW